MTRPVLIYSPTHDLAEATAEALGGMVLTAASFNEVLGYFHSGVVEVLVTTGGYHTGFRVPENTLILFLDGFDDRPEVRAQIAGRLERAQGLDRIVKEDYDGQ